jgi:hypothetical protein
VEARVREVDLPFDARCTNDLEPRGRRGELVEKRRLTNAWIAVYDECGTAAISHGRKQLLESRKLTLPTDETTRPGGRQLAYRTDVRARRGGSFARQISRC